MARITGDSDITYNFGIGDIILIEGDEYTMQDARDNTRLRLSLHETGSISKKITIQVGDGCILYLLWIVKSNLSPDAA